MTPRIEARKLLQDLKLGALPISLMQVCKSLKIPVFFDRLTGLDGFFVQHPETHATAIIVNDSTSLFRQRFSIAHEIGHIRMRHGLAGCSVSGQIKRSPELEVSANIFASELLMPKMFLQRHGYLKPEQISALCCVSLDAAAIRAKELGWA